MTRRVVITGMGTVNPLASDLKGFWEALRAGKSGVSLIGLFDTSKHKVHFGGEVKNFHPETLFDLRAIRRMDRFAQFALVAAHAAVKDSGFDISKEDPYRCGVIIGSGIGGFMEFEEQHTRFLEGGRTASAPSSCPR